MNIAFIYQKKFFTYAFKLTGSEDDAKDIIQAVAVKLWIKNYQDKDEEQMGKIAMRSIYNHFVSLTRRNVIEKMELPVFAKPAVLDRLELKDLMATILESKRRRFKMVLAAAMGYNTKELMQGFEASESCVLSAVSYGRKALREHYK